MGCWRLEPSGGCPMRRGDRGCMLAARESSPWKGSVVRQRARRPAAPDLAGGLVAAAAAVAAGVSRVVAGAAAAAADASVRIDPGQVAGGEVPAHFVGVSVEWSLIDRYMGPGSRAGFARLLRSLDSGLLRIGGSSQDQIRFDATAPDSERVITPNDLASIRATLDMVDSTDARTPAWVTVLGTTMAPPTPQFPWRSVAETTAFVRDGAAPVFGDDQGRRELAGISLGNEPDLTYSGDLTRYLSDFAQ